MIIRSIVFVPGHKEKMVAKSLELGADAVVWDLEDAVPLSEKDEARKTVRHALENLPPESIPVYVRINSIGANMLHADVKAIFHPNLHGVMLAKTEKTEEVGRLEQLINELELRNGAEPGQIKIHCILETCLGALRAYEISSSSARLEGVSFGAEDFTLDLGTARTREGAELMHARGAIAMAAGAAKVMAIDSVFTDLNDEEGLINECRLARQLGFKGKYAIHPKQIEVINREFSPSEKEIAFAEKVVTAFAKAQAENVGVITVDGKMVDPPVVEKAKQILKFRK